MYLTTAFAQSHQSNVKSFIGKYKLVLLFCKATPDVLCMSACSAGARSPHSNTDDIIVRMKCALFT